METDEKICPRCAETVKMAAKVCKHCGYEFTAADQPIPAPSSPAPSSPPAQQPVQVNPPYRPYSPPPPPPQMAADPPARGRTLLIVLAVIVGVIVVLAVIGIAVGPEEPGGAKQAVNANTSSGADTAGSSDQNAAPADNGGSSNNGDSSAQADTTAVSSVELARAYNANEVSAQNTYGGKTLDVTGTIVGVKLDLFNNPVVEMEGVNEFLPVQATFDQSYSQKVSALSKGQEITVRCTEITEVISAPMLSECSLPE